MADNELTQEQLDELSKTFGVAPVPDEKHNVHSFLKDVVVAEDTTKLGNLSEEEVGFANFSLRLCKELGLYCTEIGGMPYFAKFFNARAEILTSTSLSKGAKLIDAAVRQIREQSNILKAPAQNKGWFRKKNKNLQGGDSI